MPQPGDVMAMRTAIFLPPCSLLYDVARIDEAEVDDIHRQFGIVNRLQRLRDHFVGERPLRPALPLFFGGASPSASASAPSMRNMA